MFISLLCILKVDLFRLMSGERATASRWGGEGRGDMVAHLTVATPMELPYRYNTASNKLS